MLLNEKNHHSQRSESRGKECPESDGLSRVICSKSREHVRVSNLCKMGLSLQAIAAITGLTEKELRRFQSF